MSGANLDGANFSNASFYSSEQQACQPTDCGRYVVPTCASAHNARMSNTKFNNAYLAGVDMGSTTANAVNFSHAILFGASFSNATMNVNPSTGVAADFSYAFLQGANFTNALVDGANFTNAYFDTESTSNCMQILLQNEYTAFPGFKSGTTGACVTDTQPMPTCIQYTYGASTLPTTKASNSCPNAKNGPCKEAQWTPQTPLAQSSQKNSVCAAIKDAVPLCDGFTRPLNTCW